MIPLTTRITALRWRRCIWSLRELPQKPSIDDTVPAHHKICAIFMQNLRSQAAIEAALSQTGVIPTKETLDEVGKRGRLGGSALLSVCKWAMKHPCNQRSSMDFYHTMLKALGRRKNFDQLQELLHEMQIRGPAPTQKTIVIVMARYVRARKATTAIQIFLTMEEFGLVCDVVVFNSLLHELCENRYVRRAQSLVSKMTGIVEPDGISYTILIGGWVRDGNMGRAFRVLDFMVENGFRPDCVTWNYIVEGLCESGKIENAVNLLNEMDSKGCVPVAMNYNTVISALCSAGALEKGLVCYREMLGNGCKPNSGTYAVLVKYLLRERRVADALELVDKMFEFGVVVEPGTVNSFILPLCRYGPPHAALQVYRRMKRAGVEPNLRTYKLLLMRLGRFGHWGKMWDLWKEMGDRGLDSDAEVYDFLVNGFCNGGRLDQACRVLGECIERGFSPSKIVCCKLVKKLEAAKKWRASYSIRLQIKECRNRVKLRRMWCAKGWQFC